jgi:hypothetical protein
VGRSLAAAPGVTLFRLPQPLWPHSHQGHALFTVHSWVRGLNQGRVSRCAPNAVDIGPPVHLFRTLKKHGEPPLSFRIGGKRGPGPISVAGSRGFRKLGTQIEHELGVAIGARLESRTRPPLLRSRTR